MKLIKHIKQSGYWNYLIFNVTAESVTNFMNSIDFNLINNDIYILERNYDRFS